ncbi:DNA polymerase ligase-domain-containing protein [Exophiala viscosa]|nr:DNA polymerase ligase-domain-containing protein [Exophiala viscosa]
MKRQRDQVIVENPFVKPENQSWAVTPPASLHRTVSPPPTNPRRRSRSAIQSLPTKSDTAAVEAGEIEIDDHVSFFSSKLLAATRASVQGQPRLSHDEWLNLYQRNLHDRGHHFVVHQHDHPVAGTHYDLRLQCNATSSISFSIPFGLPGDPNSRRLNRNAIETRVHNLWNHLIETASYETGTMLLWDTGEYFVLPHSFDADPNADAATTDSDSDSPNYPESEPAKLHRAFQGRKIKIRLNGTRLPKDYTLSIRLTHENNALAQPKPPSFKRRRKVPPPTTLLRKDTADSKLSSSQGSNPSRTSTHDRSSVSPVEDKRIPRLGRSVSSLLRTASPPSSSRNPPALTHQPASSASALAPEPTDNNSPAPKEDKTNKSRDEEDQQIRERNAYPGATNTINSVHQRRWFLSIDREASGFRPTNRIEFGRRVWERPLEKDSPAGDGLGGFPSFYVRGRDVETSILTGRLAADVATDEGLVNYKPRGGWRPVTD